MNPTASMPVRWRPALYCLLGLMLSFEAGYVAHVVRDLTQYNRIATQPFGYDFDQKVTWERRNASRAGLARGDRILAIDGRPFVSDAVLTDALARLSPGRLLPLQVARGGQVLALSVPLPHLPAPLSFPVAIVSWLLVPIVCTLLAVWIALTRPREITSWILLGLLLSFSMLNLEPGWPWSFRTAALACESLLPETLGIWLLLFGLHFPHLPGWKSRLVVPVWLLIAAMATGVALDGWVVVTSQIDFSLRSGIVRYYDRMQQAANLLLLLSLVAFAAILSLKIRYVGSHSDLYRRLQLMAAGATIGLAPLLTTVIVQYVKGNDAVPSWLLTAVFFLLLVFPLTLAYVMLVYRALDGRAILRDGLRRLSESRRQGYLQELLMVSLLAGALFWMHSPPALTTAASIAAFFLLLHVPVVRYAGNWIDRIFFRESHQAEQLLLQTVNQMSTIDGAEPLLERVAARIAATMQVQLVAVLLREGDLFRVRAHAGVLPGEPVTLPAEGSVVAQLLADSKPLPVYSDYPSASIHRPAAEEAQALAALRAQILLPMSGGEGLCGILSLGPRRWDQAYSQMDMRLLSALANECSLVVENARLVRRLTEEIHERECKHAEKVAAEQAAHAKSELLAQMSHELRTPLNAILGYSEMLREEAEDSGAATMIADLNKIHGAGQHLLNMINSVLDMAKLESGRTTLSLEIFSLERLMRETAGIAAPLMARNRNQFVLDIASELGAMEADLTKLRQVVLNLLSNAAKFTADGTVTLRAMVERVDGVAWARIEVRDTGIGMTEEQIARLCVPFRQADASIARKYGGTGLGLAISRQFCQLMRGDISIASQPGHGSVFTIRLPIAVSRYEQSLDETPSAPLPVPGGSVVLVIDDDPVVQDLVLRFCSGLPLRVVSSETGAGGISIAQREVPACILLDILLPDKDGWSVLRELKADPRTAIIPVLICSIIGEPGFALSLGAAGVLSKPLMRNELLRTLPPLLRGERDPLQAGERSVA